MSGIENAFLAQVQADVQKDRVDRDHDVFLSHTSDDRDIEVSTDLYAELTGRGLDVWYDGAELRLGRPAPSEPGRGPRLPEPRSATLLDSTSLQDDTLQQRARWRR